VIINSLLENDFYTFTVWQMAFHQLPDIDVEYAFKCRNDVDLLPFKDEIEQEISNFCTLKFTEEELSYLRNISFIQPNFVEYLEDFRPKKRHIKVEEINGKLSITIKGSWLNTIIFEVPILAIVNEVYFRNTTDLERALSKGRLVLKHKMHKIDKIQSYGKDISFQFADFGMRRRYSSIWHDEVVRTLVNNLPFNFIGTSNVFLAKRYKIIQIGSMSHQLIQVGQGLNKIRLSESQKYMLDMWVKEYRGNLGIALSDTLGFDAFLNDFDLFFAKLYDGCRHDSGDPFVWGEKLIAHYKKLKIDPTTKTAVFSDGLTVPLALDLFTHFCGRIKTSFGIGTNLTNDCSYDPLQIVIKLVRVNGHPVAKISDSPGKGMCEDTDYLKYLKTVFNVR
jgi:nicotinate phosphoribosyltransferase